MKLDRRTDVHFKTAYSPHRRVTFETVGKSRTKQSFKKECDINNILAKFAKTGVFDHVERRTAQYGEVDGADLHTLMNVVAEGNSAFEELSPQLRARFKNSEQLLAFVGDESNRDEAIELGLVEALVPGVPDEAPEEPVRASGEEPEAPAHIPT